MSIDDLKKECQYCCLEIDASGLEGFRCTNRTVIKTTNSSWCYPKNADMPCSTCEYCYPKQDMKMSIDRAIEIINHYLDYPYEEVREALLLAINTMRKYEKIEQLITDYEEYKWERIDVKDMREIINGDDKQ